jgi:DNA-binding XRE family transcriptional regulator
METGSDRLGRLVRETRRQLRITQRQAAAFGGISEQTWGVVENAKADNFADLTLSAIDVALGWPPGSAQRVFDDPDYIPGATGRSTTAEHEQLLGEVADLLRRVQETLEDRQARWDRLARGEGGNDHRGKGGAR